MKASQAAAANVDRYIAGFPPAVQRILRKIRTTIRKAAPTATESISYGIPAYTLNGRLIYFAGFTKHVSIYPAPRGAGAFKEELAGYKGGKGTVQFPLDRPIPYGLITRIVKFRAKQNREGASVGAKQP
jgi:uncharacterized protein YdhG (YjbR/CyaY superfamily)